MVEPSRDVPTVEAGGASIPRLGLGTSRLDGEECADVVSTAIDLGYRHVDTAEEYDNERAVGRGIAAADVDREDVFLTTKVGMDDLHYDDVVESVHGSLERLDVDSVDLLLIHGPDPWVPPAEPLEAMAELRASGHVEHLGVSNFSQSQLEAAMAVADAPIVTNQVMYHPYKDQSALRRFCVDNDVVLTAYSPLARGGVLDDEVLAAIGARHGRSAAQVALRWLLQQDGVAAVPRTADPAHLEENLAVFDFVLTDEDVSRVDDLGPDLRRRLGYTTREIGLRFVSLMWRLR